MLFRAETVHFLRSHSMTSHLRTEIYKHTCACVTIYIIILKAGFKFSGIVPALQLTPNAVPKAQQTLGEMRGEKTCTSEY